MNIEIELRYQVVDESQVSRFVQSLKFLHKKRVIDIYLDTSTADLIKRGIYIRIRDNAKVDIKFDKECLTNKTLGLQAYCEEHSFVLPLVPDDLTKLNVISKELGLYQAQSLDFEEYKTRNNLLEHRTVDKVRSSYRADEFVIVVDEVTDLGTFIEIEMMAEDTSRLESVRARMQEVLKDLNLNPLRTGYDSLVLRKHNFAQYLQGRFILEEDERFLMERNADKGMV